MPPDPLECKMLCILQAQCAVTYPCQVYYNSLAHPMLKKEPALLPQYIYILLILLITQVL